MPSASRHTRTVPSSPPLMMTGVHRHHREGKPARLGAPACRRIGLRHTSGEDRAKAEIAELSHAHVLSRVSVNSVRRGRRVMEALLRRAT